MFLSKMWNFDFFFFFFSLSRIYGLYETYTQVKGIEVIISTNVISRSLCIYILYSNIF